jgi:hypothetical protein
MRPFLNNNATDGSARRVEYDATEILHIARRKKTLIISGEFSAAAPANLKCLVPRKVDQ